MEIAVILLCALLLCAALLAAVSAVGGILFRKKFRLEAKAMLRNVPNQSTGSISEADMKGLPVPLQKHLRNARIPGRDRPVCVRLKQRGEIRMGPEKKWQPFRAEQYYVTRPPGLIWLGMIKPVPLLSIQGRDIYTQGRGNMLIKLLSLFPVVNEQGPDMDEATLMRYMNEMMWFPGAYVDPSIEWEERDKSSVTMSLTDGGLKLSAELRFNEKHELANFIAMRYNSAEKRAFLWSTPIHEYGEFDGFRIPVKGEAISHLPSGDFSYIRLVIEDIEYNTPEIY